MYPDVKNDSFAFGGGGDFSPCWLPPEKSGPKIHCHRVRGQVIETRNASSRGAKSVLGTCSVLYGFGQRVVLQTVLPALVRCTLFPPSRHLPHHLLNMTPTAPIDPTATALVTAKKEEEVAAATVAPTEEVERALVAEEKVAAAPTNAPTCPPVRDSVTIIFEGARWRALLDTTQQVPTLNIVLTAVKNLGGS